VLRSDFESQLIYRLRRKCNIRKLKQWLTILLLSSLVLLTSFEPLFTFSGYVVNKTHSFTLSTSNFYLLPSLELDELIIDMETGFSQVNNLTVANNDGTHITTHTTAYTITLEEDRATPLFDLYIDDGAGGKTKCPNNTISDTLIGGSAVSKSYALYFRLKDAETPIASYPVKIKLTSSEPYIRTYSFTVNITLDSSMIIIPGTDLPRPNVEIPDDSIMVFKDDKYDFLTLEDLLAPIVIDDVVEERERPELIGGSLYVPASIGDILVEANQTIDWDVAGNIVIEPDIVIDNGNIQVDMLSRSGDIIINRITISGPKYQPYIVNITSENGKIEASGTVIESKSDGDGIINLVAQDDIDISAAEITSLGNYGVNIESQEGNINADNAIIKSTNGAANATVKLSSVGQVSLNGATVESNSSSNPPLPALFIESTNMGVSARNAHITSTNAGKLLEIRVHDQVDLDQAIISSQGAITISSAADISAKSASMISAADAKDISITTTNGSIVLSSLEETGLPQTVMSSKGNIIIQASGNIEAKSTKMTATKYNNLIEIISSTGQVDLSSSTTNGIPITDITATSGNINIKSYQDIFIETAKITASTRWGMKLQFESTGSNSRLWVQSANLEGSSIIALNFEVIGNTANGTITIGQ
jgi:hypothetical protein